MRRLSLAELYSVLVDEGKTLTISAAPVEMPAVPMPAMTDESASESAPEPFEDTGEPLTSEIHRKRLPVAMRAAQLDNRLRTIHSQGKAMLDSTGSNLLYLALGFLEWHDPQNEPEKARVSPLLLVPVEIERHLERIEEDDENGDDPRCRSRMGVKIYRYTIKHDGEDVSSNLPLILRLRRSPFSLELESYESADDSNGESEGNRFDDIEDYFCAVEQAVARLPSDVVVKPWRVIRAARVGFFTFFKEVIWRDLDPERWPEKTPLLEKPWITAALEGREKFSEPRISDGEVERAMHDEPLPTVLDADGGPLARRNPPRSRLGNLPHLVHRLVSQPQN